MIYSNDRRSRWLSSCVLLAPMLGGCGGSLPPPSEPGQAKQILTDALDAWKRGDKPDAPASGKTPVRVLDREWSDGAILEGYAVEGDGQPLGLNVQQAVTLQLKTPQGKALKKTVNYLVTTGRNPMIARQDIDE